MLRSLLVTIALLLLGTMSFAQTPIHAGKVGLGIDGVSSPNLILKYFFNNQLAGQVIVGVEFDSPGGDAPLGLTKVTGTTFRGGLSFLYHLTQTQMSTYIGVEGIFQSAQMAGFYVQEPDRKSSVMGGAVLGGEYFIHDQFTLGIKQMLGLDVQLKRDNPAESSDVRFATSTVVTGRFYFD
ncbi:MAG TPA: hypothetical protein VFG32_02070 [Bacteroidota bacterium]|nr:hypothetical protein [Bacteroidota bacterium]